MTDNKDVYSIMLDKGFAEFTSKLKDGCKFSCATWCLYERIDKRRNNI